jgi:hypothetical protein
VDVDFADQPARKGRLGSDTLDDVFRLDVIH